ncbi:HotDog domain-containing protein [Baffinella frigidus]|nr:HotDog domain-containing protein [Cryptophyta sp. CCMP2293]
MARVASMHVGATGKATCTVEKGKNTAAELGSGDMDVFGTPAMVALMEAAACDALRSGLAAGETSVGTHVDVKHLAATPLGMQVTATASVSSVEKRTVTLEVEARDSGGAAIGSGTHTRQGDLM